MTGTAQMLTVRVPLAVRKRSGQKVVMMPKDATAWAPQQPRASTTLVKALARAFRWRRMLETNRHSTMIELAAAERINESYVSRILRLTLLAPEIVEAILDGRQPDRMTLPGLMAAVPVEWEGQDRTFARIRVSSGFPDPAAAPGAAAWSRRSGTGSAR